MTDNEHVPISHCQERETKTSIIHNKDETANYKCINLVLFGFEPVIVSFFLSSWLIAAEKPTGEMNNTKGQCFMPSSDIVNFWRSVGTWITTEQIFLLSHVGRQW